MSLAWAPSSRIRAGYLFRAEEGSHRGSPYGVTVQSGDPISVFPRRGRGKSLLPSPRVLPAFPRSLNSYPRGALARRAPEGAVIRIALARGVSRGGKAAAVYRV